MRENCGENMAARANPKLQNLFLMFDVTINKSIKFILSSMPLMNGMDGSLKNVDVFYRIGSRTSFHCELINLYVEVLVPSI